MTPPALYRSRLRKAEHAVVAAAARVARTRRLGWRNAARWVGYVYWLETEEYGAGNVARLWRAVRRTDLEVTGPLNRFIPLGFVALRRYAGRADEDTVRMKELWPAIRATL